MAKWNWVLISFALSLVWLLFSWIYFKKLRSLFDPVIDGEPSLSFQKNGFMKSGHKELRAYIYHGWISGNVRMRRWYGQIFAKLDSSKVEVPKKLLLANKFYIPITFVFLTPVFGIVGMSLAEDLGFFNFGFGSYDLDLWNPNGGIALSYRFILQYIRPLIRHPLFWIIIAVLAGRWIYLRKKKRITR